MGKLIVIGESLIDKILGEEYVGGAPLNVSCYASKYVHAIFLNKLSEDYMSKKIYETLIKYNVDTSYIKVDKDSSTCYSNVSLDENNERTFTFNYENASFTKLTKDEIPFDIFQKGDILYFGSVFFLSENGIEATKKCIEYANKNNMKVAFDINYRDKLFPNVEQFKDLTVSFLKQTNILKMSIEEYNLLFAIDINEIFTFYPNLETVILTLGENGAKIITRNNQIYQDGIKVDVKDTTGCGDAFFGTYLGLILLNQFNDEEILNKCVQLSSKVASYKGALIPLECLD